MSIEVQPLGNPGEDNAALFRVNSGNSIELLLFDCGERCLDAVSVSDIQSIDHVFFSHYHMDHVCGFDTFFRHNYNRREKPVMIWGPPGSIDLIHHRMRGFSWNLHQRQPGEWIVNEIGKNEIRRARFYTRQAFRKGRLETIGLSGPGFLDLDHYSVSAFFLNHGSIPSIGYRVDEPDRENVDPGKLEALGVRPGPWVREIKEWDSTREDSIEIEGEVYSIASLRNDLLVNQPGESAAYLTDFVLKPDSGEWNEVTTWLNGVTTLLCEAQYRESDRELAEANAHMTTLRVAKLAADSGAGQLIMQHVSRRYERHQWNELLDEAREQFSRTRFPDFWRLRKRAGQKAE